MLIANVHFAVINYFISKGDHTLNFFKLDLSHKLYEAVNQPYYPIKE